MVGESLIPQVEGLGHQGALLTTLGEKSFERRQTLNGNQEESRQEKETLASGCSFQKFPEASREKHLLRGFLFRSQALAAGLLSLDANSGAHHHTGVRSEEIHALPARASRLRPIASRNTRRHVREAIREQRIAVCTKSSCLAPQTVLETPVDARFGHAAPD